MNYLQEVSSHKQLKQAWRHVRRKRNVTPGIDGESVKDFNSKIRTNLIKISTDLKKNKYQFSKVEEIKIPKHSNTAIQAFRAIRIYSIRDKIVQRSIQISLERIGKTSLFPELKNNISIGFVQKGFSGEAVGVKLAVNKTKQYYKEGCKYLTTMDIKDFFEKIPKKKLLSLIMVRCGTDKSLKELIKKCLDPQIVKRDRYTGIESALPSTHSGVAQGSILSPLFSNIYLIKFDKTLESNNVKAVRYADDVAFFSKTPREDKKQLYSISRILKSTTGLTFYSSSSKKPPQRYTIESSAKYLGIHIRKAYRSRWLIAPTSDKIKSQLDLITDVLNPNRPENLFIRVGFLNRSINSWIRTYSYVGCTKKELAQIYTQLKDKYESNLNHLLLTRKIIKTGLTKQQLNFFNVLSPRSNSFKKRRK